MAIQTYEGQVDVDYGYVLERGPFLTDSPDYFMHFAIGRAELARPRGGSMRRIGGLEGRLVPGARGNLGAPYFGNHLRFFWPRDRESYVATLHTFGPATVGLLSSIVAASEPTRRIETIRRPALPRVGDRPGSVASAPQGVVVGTLGGPSSTAALVLLDSSGQRIISRREIPGLDARVASNGTRTWAVLSRLGRNIRVQRLDSGLRPGLTRKVGSGEAGGVCISESSLWVSSNSSVNPRGTGLLLELDPDSGEVVRRHTVPWGAGAVACADGEAWLANGARGTVTRFTGSGTRTFRIGGAPSHIAIGEDSVWVADVARRRLVRVRPTEDAPPVSVPTDGSPYFLLIRDGQIIAPLIQSELAVVVSEAEARIVNRIGLPDIDPVVVFATSGASLTAISNTDGQLVPLVE